MKNILFFVSGHGTNFSFILNNIKKGILFNCKINGIVSNNDCVAFKNAIINKIPSFYKYWDKNLQTREEYDLELLNFVKYINPDIIVLAGWNHILSSVFIDSLDSIKIINLHPALLNTFPGNNAIEDAWAAAQKGLVKKTGIMVHTVTNELDVGEVISTKEIAIEADYKLKKLEEKIKYEEKFVLLDAIFKLTCPVFKRGKVKDIYNISDDRLLIMHTDRLSSCNKIVCDLEGKGHMLSLLTNYWFNKTKDIVDNHVLEQKDNYLIVKKCKLIPVEFIVRGYITGSMWKKYSQGERKFCGNLLEDNLTQYQKLNNFIITPTTKDEFDLPIDYNYIIENKLLTKTELDRVYDICSKLYVSGQYECDLNGLIMCDTKYEFGKDENGNIVLIDELHTIESSRYWKKDTYKERISKGLSPENLDKDIIREYVKNDQFVPESSKQTLLSYYKYVYETLSKQTIDNVVSYKNIDIKKLLQEFNSI